MQNDQTEEKKRLVVGLDCSTTGTKAVAFDREGSVAARAQLRIPLHSPRPNHYEQDPLDWWNSAREVLRMISGQVDPRRIEALAVSNQRETFVPLARDEHFLRPAIIWLDERCKDEVDPFSRRIGKNAIHRVTGKPPDYAPVVYRLAWMKRHEPRLFRNIGMICDVQTYLVRKLTGSYTTSWASADPLGLFDVRNKRWAPVILKALELTQDQLPALCSPGTIIGPISKEASEATGLSTATAVVAGGGDGQAAGLGANVLSPKRAYLNLGTAVVAGIYGRWFKTSKAFRTMCSCSHDGYYFECSLRAGTFAIDWLIKNVLNIDPSHQPGIYEQLQREALTIPPGSEGLMHLPYLCGVMNPFWDMNARGAFVGLTSSHHRGHLYRSILEGIAFEQYSAIRSAERALGSTVNEFVSIGGGATSEFWNQIFADITGKTVCIPAVAEASALGAAIAAAVGIGWCRTFREAASRMTGIERIIRPNAENRKEYERLFAIYRKVYPSLRKMGIAPGGGRIEEGSSHAQHSHAVHR